MSLKILIVCSGNTCRSPMAAALLQGYRLDNAQVQSAGVEAADDLPPTRHSVLVMRELGFDISSHRSQNIKNVDQASFDLFLAMTPSIADQLRKRGVNKTRIEELNIPDPYDRDIDVYRSTVKEIERQLRSLLPELEKFASTMKQDPSASSIAKSW